MLNPTLFDEHHVLHELKHYLPAQAPLKDFVHHNTLHAFQHQKFHKGIQAASAIFGYKVYLSLAEYRNLFATKKIPVAIIESVINRAKGATSADEWKQKLLHTQYTEALPTKIGLLRAQWKKHYKLNLDKEVHPMLFRLVGSYLDQGIAIWKFPASDKGLLATLKELERSSFAHLFKSPRVRDLLLNTDCQLKDLLDILVGNEALYERYLFDQQFAHPGWAGMVAVIENQPESLLDNKKITLRDFIALELLFEIDALDKKTGNNNWPPLAQKITEPFPHLFEEMPDSELNEVYTLWQEAFEWTYYDQVLKGLQLTHNNNNAVATTSFQALFCIDDRECSIRRHVEKQDPHCKTYGTAGFFNVEFYFQPEHGKFYTKVCPAPLTPKYLIKETEATIRHEKEAHFSKHSKGLLTAFFMSQTVGFLSAIKLVRSIFKPTETSAMVSSSNHMDRNSKLSIDYTHQHSHDGLQIGFTVEEMANRVEGLLKSIGLVNNFAPLVYIIGHGASSVNNTHYAGYDCGACSGRAGSVNARVGAYMANKPEVRDILKQRGIEIPDATQFVGGLHDTTRDEIEFYDEELLNSTNALQHQSNIIAFNAALDDNAKERSRRFLFTNSSDDVHKVHKQVKLRSLSLFEPRPEWNHATNALCIIGRREANKHLFLDRRSFLNSYDYTIDPDGKYLLGIMKAIAPVCGGINLEYYFSRVDNYRLGAGTKLPHNVMGLIGVANGMDGDLRPGLPKQMVNIHDPIRLMAIVEHYPHVVLKTIQEDPTTYEWFNNEWVHLAVIKPDDKTIYYFKDGAFTPYQPITAQVNMATNLEQIMETVDENLPVYIVQ